jgi:chorismate synthase
MAGNSFGEIFRITTFGESHGPGIGVVIDGCPPGLKFDEDFVSRELSRRAPGQSEITTSRKETEVFRVLSGVFEGITTGSPLTIFIPNTDQRPGDYDHLKDTFRPSHADFTYVQKYGHRDHRGGGRASARETAARVAAGAVAKIFLLEKGLSIKAYVSQAGNITLDRSYKELDLDEGEKNIVRCPHPGTAAKMIELIAQVREEGDSIGGVVSCVISGCAPGLGEPVFDKLHADLGKAMLSINAVKGFDYGSGFGGVGMKGSEHNDIFSSNKGHISTETNHSGGVQGGISNGEDIYFRVAFKPPATILQSQQSIDKSGHTVELAGKGRHDPCVLPRAVPIVEAMAALVIMDHYLRNRMYAINE